MNARVVAVYNRKGGTGKTTLTLAAAGAAARAGAQVVLLDADPAQDAATVAAGWQGVTAGPWRPGWRAEGIADDADLVLIDCPPDYPVPKAVADAELVVVPVTPEPLAVRRLARVIETLDAPYVVVVNGYYAGASTTVVLAELTELLGDRLWLPPIPRRTVFPRAQETATPVQEFRGRPAEVLEATAALAARMLTWAPTT